MWVVVIAPNLSWVEARIAPRALRTSRVSSRPVELCHLFVRIRVSSSPALLGRVSDRLLLCVHLSAVGRVVVVFVGFLRWQWMRSGSRYPHDSVLRVHHFCLNCCCQHRPHRRISVEGLDRHRLDRNLNLNSSPSATLSIVVAGLGECR